MSDRAKLLTSLGARFKAAAAPEVPQLADAQKAITQAQGEGFALQPPAEAASSGPGAVSSGLHSLFSAFGPKGEAVYKHLPSVRLPDTVAGGLLGAGGGWLVDRMRGKRKGRSTLGSVLAGAGVGAALGNVVGDRARRYVSNKVMPASYEDPSEQLKPRGLSDFWDAAVADKPSYDPKKLEEYLSKGPEAADVLGARRELFRRSLGVHVDDPSGDVWARNPSGTYSVNPGNPRGKELAEKFLFGDSEGLASGSPATYAGLAGKANSGGPPTGGLMGPVVGGQSVTSLPVGPGQSVYSVRDRWDTTVEPAERAFAASSLGKMLRGNFGHLSEPSQGAYSPAGQTNAGRLRSLGARWLFDNVLAKERPWVEQNVVVNSPKDGPRSAVPLTGPGGRYE